MSNPGQTQPNALDAAAAVDVVAGIANAFGRDDLAQRLIIAAARARRPATIICVVGEFKQGKSSLVNALLGVPVCPVDDDIATSALTLLRYGDEPGAEVRRRTDEGLVVESLELSELADWVSERGNPDNVKGVERVDIALPHPLLADGLAIVDTPGMGGLGAGHAAATLAFLPFADGLVFVTDASAELSEPEAEFLQRASELCPNIALVLSKTDLYPAWRRIAALDAGWRAHHDGGRPILPVASALMASDDGPDAAAFNEMSGIPALLVALDDWIVAPAKGLAAARALAEADDVLDQINEQLHAELEVLEDPRRVAEIVARLTEATAHLEQLRGPGARWSVLVADRVSDLSNSSGHQFRTAMRVVSRDMEEAIELLKTPEDWDQLARRLQTDVADAVTDVFVEIERGAEATREAVVELIGEDALTVASLSSARDGVELSSLWTAKGIDPTSTRRGGQQLGATLTGLRGAQSGIIMFGMLGQFLPAGAAALMMSNPITIGIGAVFAGMQLADAHKRKIAMRRQQARVNVRQFLDDVQFAVGNELTGVMRDVQRGLRDEFTERISELSRTYAEAATQAQLAAQQSGAAAAERLTVLRPLVERISSARSSLEVVSAT